MKKYNLIKIICILILLVSLSSMAFSGSPEILVSTLRYSPTPLNPGDSFDIWLQIDNTGDAADNFRLEFLESIPFYLEITEKKTKTISRVEANSISQLHYDLRVRDDVEAGEYLFKYRFKTDEISNWKYGQLSLDVETMDSNLVIKEVNVPEGKLYPGSINPVSIVVENIADSSIKNVKMRLKVFSVNPVSGAYLELPFTPIGSSDEKIKYNMRQGESHEFTFNLLVDPDAEVKPYKLPIELSYQDDQGMNYTKNLLVGLLIDLEPDLLVVTSDKTIMGNKLTFDVKFINKGLIDLKFFEAHLGDSSFVDSVLSESNQYIGDLESDDYESLQFVVTLPKDALKGNSIEVPLIYSYLSSNNKRYNEQTNIVIDLSTATKVGGNSSTSLIIGLLIVVVFGIFIIRRRKKKRESELNAKVNRRK